jgi:hypothetical protein
MQTWCFSFLHIRAQGICKAAVQGKKDLWASGCSATVASTPILFPWVVDEVNWGSLQLPSGVSGFSLYLCPHSNLIWIPAVVFPKL